MLFSILLLIGVTLSIASIISSGSLRIIAMFSISIRKAFIPSVIVMSRQRTRIFRSNTTIGVVVIAIRLIVVASIVLISTTVVVVVSASIVSIFVVVVV